MELKIFTNLLGPEGEKAFNEKIKEIETEESSKWKEPIRLKPWRWCRSDPRLYQRGYA